MKISEMLHRPSLWSRLSSAVRRAAARSPMVRGVLWTGLAIGVTVGGVLAGALIVAPVAAKVSHPETVARTSQAMTSTSTAMSNIAREMTTAAVVRWRSVASTVTSSDWSSAIATSIANSPESTRKLALPLLAIVTMLAAVSVVLLRRRTPAAPTLALVPVATPRVRLRSTPKPAGRPMGRTDHRTPKAVEALAASGASTADIAQRTGLPIDAVSLLLSISTGSRQVQPPSA
jgi:gas vesicle protein